MDKAKRNGISITVIIIQVIAIWHTAGSVALTMVFFTYCFMQRLAVIRKKGRRIAAHITSKTRKHTIVPVTPFPAFRHSHAAGRVSIFVVLTTNE